MIFSHFYEWHSFLSFSDILTSGTLFNHFRKFLRVQLNFMFLRFFKSGNHF